MTPRCRCRIVMGRYCNWSLRRRSLDSCCLEHHSPDTPVDGHVAAVLSKLIRRRLWRRIVAIRREITVSSRRVAGASHTCTNGRRSRLARLARDNKASNKLTPRLPSNWRRLPTSVVIRSYNRASRRSIDVVTADVVCWSGRTGRSDVLGHAARRQPSVASQLKREPAALRFRLLSVDRRQRPDQLHCITTSNDHWRVWNAQSNATILRDKCNTEHFNSWNYRFNNDQTYVAGLQLVRRTFMSGFNAIFYLESSMCDFSEIRLSWLQTKLLFATYTASVVYTSILCIT